MTITADITDETQAAVPEVPGDSAAGPQPEFRTFTGFVTPPQAEFALEHRLRNRPLKRQKIAQFKHDMENGHWLLTHQGIAFTWDPDYPNPRSDGKPGMWRLADGQNRMAAVAQSGCTVQFQITRGVPAPAMKVFDTGTPRKFSDHLAIEYGVASATKNAAVVSRLYRHDVLGLRCLRGGAARNKVLPVSLTDLDLFFREHEDEIVSAFSEVQDKPSTRQLITPSVLTYAYILFRRRDAEKAREFITLLREGAGLERGSPILALRERLIRNRDLKHQHSRIAQLTAPEDISFYLLVRAWNAWRRGEFMSKMQLPHTEITEASMIEPR